MPYIPKEHEKYNLLPWKTENGGECFVYPDQLVNDISDRLSKYCDTNLIPYGHKIYTCYQDYFDYIEELDQKYNQKFTNYVYDTNPDNWEILEDPTGMAKRTLEKGSNRNMGPTTEDLVELCYSDEKN